MFKFVVSVAVVSTLALTALSEDKKQSVLLSDYGSFATKADFYSEEYLNGPSHYIETNGECKNLPTSWQKRALSVDTRGTCAQVCDQKDCQGTCKNTFQANGNQQLYKIHMARRVASVRGCFQNKS